MLAGQKAPASESSLTPRVLRVGLIWMVCAIAAGAAGLLRAGPARLPQIVAVGLTVVVALLALGLPGFRTWLCAVDVRALVLFHVVRFVGFYFLVLYRRGELPYDFAVKGGWGDIVVAAIALIVAALPAASSVRPTALRLWNVLGAADILFVVVTAGRLASSQLGSMDALRRLPLSLLPTFVVPIIFVTHGVIFLRIWRGTI
jgi:hypothetical protein